jgi:hypothetical protein
LKSGIFSQLLFSSVLHRQKPSISEGFLVDYKREELLFLYSMPVLGFIFAAFEQEELLFSLPVPVLNCSLTKLLGILRGLGINKGHQIMGVLTSLNYFWHR